MPLTIMRRVAFNAGHRLLGHEGMCKYFHGHNYVAEFHVRADALDDVGRVVDFSELKRRLKGWVDDHWDHGFLLCEDDANGIAAIQSVDPPRLFLLPTNPTAEAMAEYLLHAACPEALRGLDVECVKVVLWETPESCATAELDAGPRVPEPPDAVRLA